MRSTQSLTITLIFTTLLAMLLTVDAAPLVYRIGVLDNKANVTRTAAQWVPTFETLINSEAARLSADFRVEVVPLSFDNLTAAVKAKSVDMTFTNTGHSAILSGLYGLVSLVSIENLRLGEAQSVFGGVVFTHVNNTAVQTLKDCVGRRIVAVSASSFGGCITQLKEMSDMGINVQTAVKPDMAYVGSHEKVLEHINLNEYDCGFVRTDKYEGSARKNLGITENLRQLNPKAGLHYAFFPFAVSTTLYPEWFVMRFPAMSTLDADLIAAIMESVRNDHPAAITGQYSRWFPPAQLGTVFDALYATGALIAEVPPASESASQLWIVGVVVPLVVILALAALWRSRGAGGRDLRNAPTDESKPCSFIFTDIQSSTRLWGYIPGVMGDAIDHHHQIIRAEISKHKCYEVKTVGDCFMIACSSPDAAVRLALDIQVALHTFDWGTKEIDEAYDAIRQEEEGTDMNAGSHANANWNGLRVRIGAHCGPVEIKFDEVTKGYDYYGTTINTCARIESCAHGGQIVASSAALDAFQLVHGTPDDMAVKPLGAHGLRGLDEPVELFQLLPATVSGRVFDPIRTEKFAEDVETESVHMSHNGSISGSTSHGLSVRAGDYLEGEPSDNACFLYLSTLFSVCRQKDRDKRLDSLLEKWKVRLPAGTLGDREKLLLLSSKVSKVAHRTGQTTIVVHDISDDPGK